MPRLMIVVDQRTPHEFGAIAAVLRIAFEELVRLEETKLQKLMGG